MTCDRCLVGDLVLFWEIDVSKWLAIGKTTREMCRISTSNKQKRWISSRCRELLLLLSIVNDARSATNWRFETTNQSLTSNRLHMIKDNVHNRLINFRCYCYWNNSIAGITPPQNYPPLVLCDTSCFSLRLLRTVHITRGMSRSSLHYWRFKYAKPTH